VTDATEPYVLTLEVVESDIDDLAHVNNVTYLRWIQDAAIAHWTHAATAEMQTTLAWVALRHEIDYKAAGFLGDRLEARTWVGAATASRFERYCEIVRPADGTVLCRSKTLWCPISRATGKLTRVSSEVRARFSIPELS
jgi:acyl-CoA thioester hydrolase